MENKPDAATLNAVQQTLRTLTVAIAGAAQADLHKLSELLESGSASPALMPEAQAMLLDLATGIGALSGRLQPANL